MVARHAHMVKYNPLQYPLVTHDPNMLKKVTGELIWKIKSVSSRREWQNTRNKQFKAVQEVCTIFRECTMKGDVLQSPFTKTIHF